MEDNFDENRNDERRHDARRTRVVESASTSDEQTVPKKWSDNQCKAWLEQLVWLIRRDGRTFTGDYGVMLENGHEYTYAPYPEKYAKWMGEPKECFANAFWLASGNPELTYVEGYACHIIPTHHAWCVDNQGNVIDPTPSWHDNHEEYGTPVYFGVPVSIDELSTKLSADETYGYFFK